MTGRPIGPARRYDPNYTAEDDASDDEMDAVRVRLRARARLAWACAARARLLRFGLGGYALGRGSRQFG